MQGNSKNVESNQEGVHPDLVELVQKHLRAPYQKPIAEHTRKAFQLAEEWLSGRAGRPLMLDSGCGTAVSSYRLALENPGANVIAIDKSEIRIGKAQGAPPANLCLLRADLVDFWLLACAANWKLQDHSIFYPNPWPKSRHLMRRFHAHPVFPYILKLGGQIHLRTNWEIYAQEFSLALETAGLVPQGPDPIGEDGEPWTAFERKYQQSGHKLWRVRTM